MNNLALIKNQQAIGAVSFGANNSQIDIFQLGETFFQAGLFTDMKSAAQCVVKILAAQELGIPAFAGMTGIHLIKGKPTLSANIMAAVIKRSGRYNYRVLELNEKACEIEFFEHKESVGKSRFTWDDAQKAGVLGNEVWKKFPKNMLFARALSNGARWYCPDVFAGGVVYTPEEMGVNVNEEGELIDYNESAPPTLKLAEQPKTVHDVQRETSPLMNLPKAETVETEPISNDVDALERELKVKEIFALCKRLSLAGDLTLQSKRLLNNYINEKWETDGGIDALDFALLDDLKDELTERAVRAEELPEPAF